MRRRRRPRLHQVYAAAERQRGTQTRRRIDYIWALSGEAQALTAEGAALFLNKPAELADGGLLRASDNIGVQALLRLE